MHMNSMEEANRLWKLAGKWRVRHFLEEWVRSTQPRGWCRLTASPQRGICRRTCHSGKFVMVTMETRDYKVFYQ
ncbi:expressed protein [Echinococcus multilocularis]|uniref:Expressed protein n=1 Tax=Echinococcus multilocularis TaxID=6211 RepID=A0A068Y713_ECHMU|nr:expressed protein [Echinococcus multilocularis]